MPLQTLPMCELPQQATMVETSSSFSPPNKRRRLQLTDDSTTTRTISFFAHRISEKIASLLEMMLPTLFYQHTEACAIDPHAVETLIECVLNDGSTPATRASPPRHKTEYGIAAAVIAMEYVERFILAFPANEGVPRPGFFHVLLITSFLLAVKQLDDHMQNTRTWAKTNGITALDMIQCEAMICHTLKWRLVVNAECFRVQYASIVATPHANRV